MKNFFYNDNFHSDIESLLHHLDLETAEEIAALPDDWKIDIEQTDNEPIIQFDIDMLVDMVQDDRMSEDGDEIEHLRKVLEKHKIAIELLFIDINAEVPCLNYANGKMDVITKQDLFNYV